MKKTFILSLLAFFCFAACEDMEDTFDEYAGNGPILYMAKSDTINVASGWERLEVTWKNNLDPKRSGIWVRCQSDNYLKDTLVGPNDTLVNFRGLADATYTITVAPVSEKGDTALTISVPGRPYTYSHEAVQGFARGFRKAIFVNNNLVMFMSSTSGVIDFHLAYTGTDGEEKEYSLVDGYNQYSQQWNLVEDFLLKDVDASKPVTLVRYGTIEDCVDTIRFPDVDVTASASNPVLIGDFESWMNERYGSVDYTRTELDLDYNLSSMEDILYFPNLTTLNFGKNRYDAYSSSTVEEQDVAEFCVETLAELNPDFRIHNYGGSNYDIAGDFEWPWGEVEEGYDFVVNESWQESLPANLVLMDTTGFTVTNSEKIEGFDQSMLLDNNASTIWNPISSTGTWDVTIDMGEVCEVDGVKITQGDGAYSLNRYVPSSISVSVSADGVTWNENPCYVQNLTLMPTMGETRLIDFTNLSDKNIRYIRLTLRDRNGAGGCLLGDAIPYTYAD